MSVRALLTRATERLTAAGVPSPRTDAELLLAHVVGTARSMLGLHDAPSSSERAAFDELLRRRVAREPLQHLTGRAAFRYLELEVGPGVFIPRPETETLVGWALQVLADTGAPPRVVDLCTGSGAIAAAIAGEAPGSTVHAVEVDPAAYVYAERNLSRTDVDLRLGDITDSFDDLDQKVDLVLANPPYVPEPSADSVEPEVREYDPEAALWSGPDGLGMIRQVERVAYQLLRPGGRVGCEHADEQGVTAPEVFAAGGHWRDVEDHNDLAGRPRFVTARKR